MNKATQISCCEWLSIIAEGHILMCIISFVNVIDVLTSTYRSVDPTKCKIQYNNCFYLFLPIGTKLFCQMSQSHSGIHQKLSFISELPIVKTDISTRKLQ